MAVNFITKEILIPYVLMRLEKSVLMTNIWEKTDKIFIKYIKQNRKSIRILLDQHHVSISQIF